MSLNLPFYFLTMFSITLFKYAVTVDSEYEYLKALISEHTSSPLSVHPPFYNDTFTFPDGVPVPPDLLDRFLRFTRFPIPEVPPWESKGRQIDRKFDINNKRGFFHANSVYFTVGFGIAMFFLGIFVVLSAYVCVVYCKKLLSERVNYLYRQQLLRDNCSGGVNSGVNNSNIMFNNQQQVYKHKAVNDIDNNINNNLLIVSDDTCNSNSNNKPSQSQSQSPSHSQLQQQHSHTKEELDKHLMLNIECIEMIDINNPSYEPQVIHHQPSLYVNTYTNKGSVTQGKEEEGVDEESDEEDETPEGEEVPNASHDLVIDE